MRKPLAQIFIFCSFITFIVLPVQAQSDYGVHDPCNIVKDGDTYFTFYTSNGVQYAYSTDLCTWRRGGQVFSSGFPSWITQYVSGFQGHFWAPEAIYMNGRWHVYYSCSSFGSQSSAIGLATSPSLKNPQWQDQGMVVYTNNSSNHNAIDADVMRTSDGKAYLVYGSFWAGIVMTELDTITGKPKNRSNLSYIADGNPEAGAAIQHGDYYYLFFNRGKCCDGVNSTYQIFVGRSTNPTGPFTDKRGVNTNRGGGTLILSTEGRFIGPGHFGYFTENGREYMSYHYYDGNQNGASKLKIITLSWSDGWPVLNKSFDPCNPGPVKDCAGVNDGKAYLDNCGVCVGGTTGKQPCKQDCNGEWGGSAETDSCGICIGEETNISPCTGSIQGEEAFEYDGVIETINQGYVGEGYFNFTNATESRATWFICADSDIQTTLNFRYANGTNENRDVSVAVNEAIQINNFPFPSTDSWTNWKTAVASVQLKKGSNRITLSSLGSEGGPNIDVIAFSNGSLNKCPVTVSDKTNHVKYDSSFNFEKGAVSFYAESDCQVNLRIYSLSGKLVKTLISGKVNRGMNSININRSEFNTGIYMLVLDNKNVKQKKLITIWR